MQCSGDRVKNQNKVMTWNLEEQANLPSHETVERDCVLSQKPILIFWLSKNLRMWGGLYFHVHRNACWCSISGRCCLRYGSFLTWKAVLGSDHPSLSTTGGCGLWERPRSVTSRTPCSSLKLLLGFFFFSPSGFLKLLGGSKTRGMISEIWLWVFFS